MVTKFKLSVASSGADPGFGQGGPASEVESTQHSGAQYCQQSELPATEVQGQLRGPGSFWGFNAKLFSPTC